MKDTDLLLTGGERRAAWVASGEKPPTFPDACPDDDFARRLCRAQAAKVLAVVARMAHEECVSMECADVGGKLYAIIRDTGLTWPPKEDA